MNFIDFTDGPEKMRIKICGLTSPEMAEACAKSGADAIGVVFYPKSPRHVSVADASKIARAVKGRAGVIGVFVNEPFEIVMETVHRVELDGVQLHGQETPEQVGRLRREGVFVIKAVFANAEPDLSKASLYEPSAFLVEAGGGKLPGGNAEKWSWQAASGLTTRRPIILAGGLSPENIGTAMQAANPRAVDVSSGVESAPGVKDLGRVTQFISAVRARDARRHNRRKL